MQCTPKACTATAGGPPLQGAGGRLPPPKQLTPLESQREDEGDGRSGLAQQDPAHAVLGVLGRDQGCPPREGHQIRIGEGRVLV